MCTSEGFEGFKVKVSAASGPSGPCVSNPSANSKSLLPLVEIPRCSAWENSKRVSFLSGKLGPLSWTVKELKLCYRNMGI